MRISSTSLLLSVALVGCSSIDAPIILGIDAKNAPACKGGPVPAFAWSSGSDPVAVAAAQIPEPVRQTTPMQKYLAQLKTAQAPAAAPISTPVAIAGGGGTLLRDVKVPETRMELDNGEFREFMKQFSQHVLSVAPMSSSTTDISVAIATPGDQAQSRSLMRLYRFYLIAYSQGKYIDRRGTKYDAPDLSSGISNKVLTTTLAIFLDAIADYSFNEPVLTDGKVFYPSGKADAPTVLRTGPRTDDNKDYADITTVRKAALVKDPMQCGLTDKEAKAVAVIGTLAEKKSAMVSGIAAEAVSGWDISFIVGGRFAFGDNKTLAELIKTFFAVSARRASERAAYQFFYDFAYTEGSTPEFLIDVGTALADEKKADTKK